MKKNKFTPMAFLASLGAGGIAVSFFAFINYTIPHEKSLMFLSRTHEAVNGPLLYLYSSLELGMFVFMAMHFALSAYLFVRLFKWLKSGEYKELISDPLANNAILPPFISVIMSFNVVIAAVRYFVPWLALNLQSIMLPGLIAWSFIWLALMATEIKLLKNSFVKGFDVSKIHFGWLLHPFALAMLSVTGAGIAAMSQSKAIADTAAFLVLISLSMGFFLFLVKAISLFKSHFAKEGLPEKQFLPSLLVVVPNITLFAITLFRLGHYLNHHYGADTHITVMMIMLVSFAFEVWYLAFGLVMLKDYIKKNLLSEFHLSQWGLVCPFVALAVLGSFVYAVFLENVVLFWAIVAVIILTISLFFFLLKKMFVCARSRVGAPNIEPRKIICS